MLKLSDLPSDIYTTILSHVPPLDRQQAVLSLSRALPRSPVPTHQIYEHIIIHTPRAVLHLYQHFRKRKSLDGDVYNPSSQVKSLSVRTWTPDADLVGNLFGLLLDVPVIQLFVGTTYSPEHLLDIFTRPRVELRTLQLRFKPYVERATYMPFLQGAYFDSTIVQLSKWPATEDYHLKNLSIAQDTISYKTHIKFAQPMAFFSFKILTELATSPIGQHVQALRISVPAKPVAAYLCAQPSSFPRLSFLDISTTALPAPSAERAIESLLGQLIRLKHIVIDRNAGTMPRDSPGWASLGRSCALAGVGRAKQREKEIQSWMESRRREEAVDEAGNPEAAAAAERAVPTAPRARRGRRGLAAATISLRERAPAPATSTSTPIASSSHDPPTRRIRIVPSPPTLRTFSTAFAGPSNPTSQQRTDWSNAFTKGFLDGCSTLNKIWGRMQDSSTVRIMRFTDTDAEPFPKDADTPDVLKGVADVAIVGHWIGWEPLLPIVCFGSERAVGTPQHETSDALWRMRMERPGAFDAEGSATGSMTPAGPAIASVGPSSVGGLWEDEAFVQWGPGHVAGCGHEIGRAIFE